MQLVNRPSQIGPHEVLQSLLINTVYHLLVNDNKGEGRWGLINFLSLKRLGRALFSRKRFLLYLQINIDAGHVNENAL